MVKHVFEEMDSKYSDFFFIIVFSGTDIALSLRQLDSRVCDAKTLPNSDLGAQKQS